MFTDQSSMTCLKLPYAIHFLKVRETGFLTKTHFLAGSHCLILILCLFILSGCGRDKAEEQPPAPTPTAEAVAQPTTSSATESVTEAVTSSVKDIATQVKATVEKEIRQLVPSPFTTPEIMDSQVAPTLAEFWEGQAEFVVDVEDTGLPMGESDTIIMADGTLWSYVHASDRSAGVVDQCGDPVEFPGCVVIYRSEDQGVSFSPGEEPTCQIACNECPCTSQFDHIEQQQYPRVIFDEDILHMVYEYQGMVMYRTSTDGLGWTHPVLTPMSGIWDESFADCESAARINDHPFTQSPYHCLMGGPPGIYTEDGMLYIFVAMGQNPSSMGCYMGEIGNTINDTVENLRHCENNPLFTSAAEYGPLDDKGPATNPFFDFRTISSTEFYKIDDRYYMLYEGVRGPGEGDPGDTQFALGLARTTTDQIDGPWETYAENPILVDQPGNIGVGHADIVVMDGVTYLYTSLDEVKRSRLVLVEK